MCTRRMPVDICDKIAIPATRDHLPRGDTLAPNRQCPLVAGTTVYIRTGVATVLGFRTYIYVRKYERVKELF